MVFLLSFILNFSILLDFEFIYFISYRFNFIILLDFYSLRFLIRVLLISFRVFIFRISYIFIDKYVNRFHYLLLSFVISIVLLIIRPNLIRILLGWDGLGIRSYLLVIYYSRTKSYNAGIITVIRNRVGDSLIIICFRRLFFIRSLNIFIAFFIASYNIYWIFILLVIAVCTKRAQIPFRAWLPAAIAAPTPVSALVHSSTLVTAGVYLIFRYERLLILINVNFILIILGALTIIIARLRAFFEIDIKKIVALSTLRQLGIIICSIGRGLVTLGFFHLLSHAFFKALLFIRAGNLIHASERYQDLRVIGGGVEVIPFRVRVIIGCSGSLCGIPFISAFYSKEAIIESILINNLSFISYGLIIAGILITIFYRIRFVTLSIRRVRIARPLFIKLDLDYYVNYRILILFVPAIRGGAFVSQKLDFSCRLLLISELTKLIVILLIVIRGIIFYKFNKIKFYFLNSYLWIIRRLWGLPFLSSRIPIFLSNNLGDFSNKFSDFSWIYYFVTTLILVKFKFQSMLGIGFTRINFIRLINLIFLVIIFIIILRF